MLNETVGDAEIVGVGELVGVVVAVAVAVMVGVVGMDGWASRAWKGMKTSPSSPVEEDTSL